MTGFWLIAAGMVLLIGALTLCLVWERRNEESLTIGLLHADELARRRAIGEHPSSGGEAA